MSLIKLLLSLAAIAILAVDASSHDVALGSADLLPEPGPRACLVATGGSASVPAALASR